MYVYIILLLCTYVFHMVHIWTKHEIDTFGKGDWVTVNCYHSHKLNPVCTQHTPNKQQTYTILLTLRDAEA